MKASRVRRAITVILFALAVALGLLTLRHNTELSTGGSCPPCPPGPHDCSLGGVWDTQGRPVVVEEPVPSDQSASPPLTP